MQLMHLLSGQPQLPVTLVLAAKPGPFQDVAANRGLLFPTALSMESYWLQALYASKGIAKSQYAQKGGT